MFGNYFCCKPTCCHDTVMGEKVLLAGDGEEEKESVRAPGEAPGYQHHHTGLPQLLLWLNNKCYLRSWFNRGMEMLPIIIILEINNSIHFLTPFLTVNLWIKNSFLVTPPICFRHSLMLLLLDLQSKIILLKLRLTCRCCRRRDVKK